MLSVSRLSIAALASCFLGASASAQIATAATVTSSASATPTGESTTTVTQSASWGALLAPLSASSVARTFGHGFLNFSDGITVDGGRIDATWISAAAGHVSIPSNQGLGWHFVNTTGEASIAATNWSYEFTATGNGLFTMFGEVLTDTPFGFGLGGWAGRLLGGSQGTQLGGHIDQGSNPERLFSFIGVLESGASYTAELYNTGSIGVEGNGEQSSYMSGEFDWTITSDEESATPEPASSLLMVTGLACLRGFVRRRRAIAG